MAVDLQKLSELPKEEHPQEVEKLTTEEVAEVLTSPIPAGISTNVLALIAQRLPEVFNYPGINQQRIARALYLQGNYGEAAEKFLAYLDEKEAQDRNKMSLGITILRRILLNENGTPAFTQEETNSLANLETLKKMALALADEFVGFSADDFYEKWKSGHGKEALDELVEIYYLAHQCELLGENEACLALLRTGHENGQFYPSASATLLCMYTQTGNFAEAHPVAEQLQEWIRIREEAKKSAEFIYEVLGYYYTELAKHPTQFPKYDALGDIDVQ